MAASVGPTLPPQHTDMWLVDPRPPPKKKDDCGFVCYPEQDLNLHPQPCRHCKAIGHGQLDVSLLISTHKYPSTAAYLEHRSTSSLLFNLLCTQHRMSPFYRSVMRFSWKVEHVAHGTLLSLLFLASSDFNVTQPRKANLILHVQFSRAFATPPALSGGRSTRQRMHPRFLLVVSGLPEGLGG